MIPTGVAEEIYVQFTPAADGYKYYYDALRIHCEGDKILIPIHAFPVINSKIDELFPKFIDMGRELQIGCAYQKKLQIESNSPVNFEYMIEVTKPHPDIHISPLHGDILGLQTTSIDFIFTPKSYSTAEAEIEIKTTEFDSKPHRISITGSSAPITGPPTQVMAGTRGVTPVSSKRNFTGGMHPISEEDQNQPSLTNLHQPKTLLKTAGGLKGGPVRLAKIEN